MSRSIRGVLAALVVAVAAPIAAPSAGAQTTDPSGAPAACEAREAIGPNTKKAALAAGLGALAAGAQGEAKAPADALLALFEQQGMKMFDGRKAFRHLGALDAWYFENCPATKLEITATDFSYEGIPDVVPAGRAAIRLTNAAPGEAHEIAMAKLTPAGEAADPEEFLPLPDKKVAKYIDFSTTGFVFADAGESEYGIVDLEPGTYIYACFVNEGDKPRGTPHWEHGMYGTFTVQ